MAAKSFKDIINSDKPVLIDFYADWCGPCQAMGPVLQQVKNTVGEGSDIIKINVDKNQALSAKYNVRSIPTFIVFKNGELKWRKTGMASAQELESVLEANK